MQDERYNIPRQRLAKRRILRRRARRLILALTLVGLVLLGVFVIRPMLDKPTAYVAQPSAVFAVATDVPSTPTPSPAPTIPPGARPSSSLFDIYPASTRYYYWQLTDAQREIFSSLYDAAASLDPYKTVSNICSREDYDVAIEALMHDCPELYFLYDIERVCEIWKLTSKYVTSFIFNISRETYQENLARMLDWIEGAAEGAAEGAYEKELAVYLYLLRHCEYAVDRPDADNALAPCLYGYGQCSGYARALILALRCQGIPCMEVYGATKKDDEDYEDDEEDELHMWCYVQIDGQWYQCDPTWDDSSLQSDFTEPYALPYFNLTGAQMLAGRSLSPDLTFMPACLSRSANYYERLGLWIAKGSDLEQALHARLDEALALGLTQIALPFESPEDYRRMQNDLSAYMDSWASKSGVGTIRYQIYTWAHNHMIYLNDLTLEVY